MTLLKSKGFSHIIKISWNPSPNSVAIQCHSKSVVCGVIWASDDDTIGDETESVHATRFSVLLNAFHWYSNCKIKSTQRVGGTQIKHGFSLPKCKWAPLPILLSGLGQNLGTPTDRKVCAKTKHLANLMCIGPNWSPSTKTEEDQVETSKRSYPLDAFLAPVCLGSWFATGVLNSR